MDGDMPERATKFALILHCDADYGHLSTANNKLKHTTDSSDGFKAINHVDLPCNTAMLCCL